MIGCNDDLLLDAPVVFGILLEVATPEVHEMGTRFPLPGRIDHGRIIPHMAFAAQLL
jgi:hypothetical protein